MYHKLNSLRTRNYFLVFDLWRNLAVNHQPSDNVFLEKKQKSDKNKVQL